MTFIEQWQDQLADSLFQFAQLEPGTGDSGFGTGLLAAAVLWPVRQTLRDGDDEAIAALTEYFNAPALYAEQAGQAASWRIYEEPPFERYIPQFGTTSAGPNVSAYRDTNGKFAVVFFGYDGGLIVSASRDDTLKVWYAESGTCLTTLSGWGPLYDCACSSYGQHIVAVGKRGIYFLQLVR